VRGEEGSGFRFWPFIFHPCPCGEISDSRFQISVRMGFGILNSGLFHPSSFLVSQDSAPSGAASGHLDGPVKGPRASRRCQCWIAGVLPREKGSRDDCLPPQPGWLCSGFRATAVRGRRPLQKQGGARLRPSRFLWALVARSGGREEFSGRGFRVQGSGFRVRPFILSSFHFILAPAGRFQIQDFRFQSGWGSRF
jgi:hypothetical protein